MERTIERLKLIKVMTADALEVADNAKEHLVAAKLDDCLACVEERIAALNS